MGSVNPLGSMGMGSHMGATTSLFGHPAARADFNLPFLLSIDETASGDNGASSAIFQDLLNELVQPGGVGDVPTLSNAPNTLLFTPGGLSNNTSAMNETLQPMPKQEANTVLPPPAGPAAGPLSPAGVQHEEAMPQAGSGQAGHLSGNGAASGMGRSGSHSSTASDNSKPQLGKQLSKRRSSKAGGAGKSEDAVMRRAAVQKRYREKKEANLQSLAAEADRQAALLAALESEHAALLSKQNALEKLVLCRDEQLQVLARVRGMCQVRSMSQSGGPQGFPQSGCWGPDCAAPATSALDNPDTLVHIQQMTMSEMRGVWLGFVNRASQLLMQITSSASTTGLQAGSAEQQLVHLVTEVGGTMRRVIQLNCPIVYGLMQINLDTGVPSYPSDAHMLRVLSMVDLSTEQQQEASSMYHLYLNLMDKVLEERGLLKQHLASLGTHGLDVDMARSPSHDGSDHQHHQHQQQLPAHLLPPGPCCADEMSCAEQLYLNLHKERSTRCLLCCFFFGKLLTPVQLARAAVASHPYFPDPLGLCRQLEQAAPAAQLTH